MPAIVSNADVEGPAARSKPRLVFIDDDEREFEHFLNKVKGEYDCKTVRWPRQYTELFGDPPPDIFVSDLYLPPIDGDDKPSDEEIQKARTEAEKVTKLFKELYEGQNLGHKERLSATIQAIWKAYALLRLQWTALGQSPDHGIALLRKLKALYPDVPFVFYSRKITPEDVVDVLNAGADDVIRKDGLKDPELLARLRSIRQQHQM